MYLLFALFFSFFNGISDPPWQIVLTKKILTFCFFFLCFFSVESLFIFLMESAKLLRRFAKK